jgi:hypothetical protein
VAAIHAKIRYVCETACEANARGEEFPADWLFHHRWAKKARGAKTADGRAITFETIGGRTTAIVPSVQRRKGGAATTTDAAAEEKGDEQLETGAVHEEEGVGKLKGRGKGKGKGAGKKAPAEHRQTTRRRGRGEGATDVKEEEEVEKVKAPRKRTRGAEAVGGHEGVDGGQASTKRPRRGARGAAALKK